MRWFVLEESTRPGIGLHVVAEVVADLAEDGSFTLRESPTMCDDRMLRSRDELLSTDEGSRALMAWESGDDTAYEEARRTFVAEALAEDDQEFAARHQLEGGKAAQFAPSP